MSGDSDSDDGSGKPKPKPAPGKKTRGRVKIPMKYIKNKLRRYTTFSKRKSNIMKKAYELSTLTGTQVRFILPFVVISSTYFVVIGNGLFVYCILGWCVYIKDCVTCEHVQHMYTVHVLYMYYFCCGLLSLNSLGIIRCSNLTAKFKIS